MYDDWGRTLKIGNFTQQDAGGYQCWAINADGPSSMGQNFSITAEGREETISWVSVIVKVCIGSHIEL